MPITELPPPPTRADPESFPARGDAFMTALPVFVAEANALQADVNAKQISAGESAAEALISKNASDANAADSATQAGIATAAKEDSLTILVAVNTTAGNVEIDRVDAQTAATQSEASKVAAGLSEGRASDSEIAAKTSETKSAASEAAALGSKNAAGSSELTAGEHKVAAQTAATQSEASKVAAGLSEGRASDSEIAAKTSETAAASSAGSASDSEGKAKTYLETLVQPNSFFKSDYRSTCFLKTGPDTLSIKAGTAVVVSSVAHVFSVDTSITMPALIPGSDYSVWVKPDGAAVAIADPYSAPATAPVPGSVKIGGFHYGLVAPGTTVAGGGFSTGSINGGGGSMAWTQPLVDKLAGINEYSLWDLCWLCKGEQRGMAYDPYKQIWAGIYFCGTNHHIDGVSAYNTNVASGTVLPKVPAAYGGDGALTYTALRVFDAHEILASHGLRLPTYDEFMGFAFGVTEAQSLGGAASTIPSTKREPGYTSRIGIEQATGHAWIFGGPIISSNGSAYAGNGRGSWYGTTSLVLLGGYRIELANSGSRAADFSGALSASNWASSVRAAGDHMRPVGVAR